MAVDETWPAGTMTESPTPTIGRPAGGRSTVATGRAMSCDVRVVVVAGSEALAARAVERITELEQRWSRFLPDSDLSRLNHAGGETVRVDRATTRLVTALVEAWHVTEGAFDPTLLPALVELGYGASRTDAGLRTVVPPGARSCGRPDEILVDEQRSVVRLPSGTAIDPGGLGKGLAADIVVEELLGAGAAGALVEIGGDLRVAGEPPEGDAWTVAIEHDAGRPTSVVRLSDGGVATSTVSRRTWTRNGSRMHHLLDPRTGLSTTGPIESVTVVAGSGRWAEALTKPVFVDGLGRSSQLMDQLGAAAMISTVGGRRHQLGAWSRFAWTDEEHDGGVR